MTVRVLVVDNHDSFVHTLIGYLREPGAEITMVDPLGFAVVGWFQLIVAGLILADRAGRNLYKVVIAGNLAVTGLCAVGQMFTAALAVLLLSGCAGPKK